MANQVTNAATIPTPTLTVADTTGESQGSGTPCCDRNEPTGYFAASFGLVAPGNCPAIEATNELAANPTPTIATVL
ncbi:hypothetical protein NUACC21_61980 [Scytonema sp. NUACC21]